MATVKVSKETYERLNDLAGKLRASLHRPVSMDEVLELTIKAEKPRPSDFAGTFVATDREADEIAKELKRFWSLWRSPRD